MEHLTGACERGRIQQIKLLKISRKVHHSSRFDRRDTIPTLRAQRQELLEKIIVWIKANPRK
jgi:hypothetical protein